MSFSSQVKEELEKHMNSARHCHLAEIAAYVINLSDVYENKEELTFSSENKGLISKIQILLKKAYGQETVLEDANGINYLRAKDKKEILSSIKYVEDCHEVSELIIKNSCCKRAYLQGTFASIGSMTSPEKGYHLEIVSSNENQLNQVKKIISDFNIESKITTRKKNYVLYVKEGASIVDLLNVMNAHVSLMNMENAIILKDMRNDLNRKVNCETANIIKSINAASRQVEDIEYLKERGEYQHLPEALKTMADIRLKYPDMPLKDLGEMLDPKVGKSGVNHRLRRLSELAQELREKEK